MNFLNLKKEKKRNLNWLRSKEGPKMAAYIICKLQINGYLPKNKKENWYICNLNFIEADTLQIAL